MDLLNLLEISNVRPSIVPSPPVPSTIVTQPTKSIPPITATSSCSSSSNSASRLTQYDFSHVNNKQWPSLSAAPDEKSWSVKRVPGWKGEDVLPYEYVMEFNKREIRSMLK